MSQNDNFEKIVKERFHLKEKSIIQFDHLKTNILTELTNSKSFTGLQWNRFPHLNEILKGHRPGELTIFTGIHFILTYFKSKKLFY